MADTSLNDLFPALPLEVGGERLSIRPVVFRELPLVQRVMEGWGQLVISGGALIPPDAWDTFLHLLASASGKPPGWVKELEPEAFEQLACFVLAINRELWDPEAPGGPGTDDDTLTWAAVVQRLAGHGHAWAAIQDFTLSQLRAFLAEAAHGDREQLAADILAASFSMADGNAVKKATRELRRV